MDASSKASSVYYFIKKFIHESKSSYHKPDLPGLVEDTTFSEMLKVQIPPTLPTPASTHTHTHPWPHLHTHTLCTQKSNNFFEVIESFIILVFILVSFLN